MKLRDVIRVLVLVLAVVVWMIPADGAFDLTGQWTFVFDTEGGTRNTSVTLQLTGEQVSGKFEKSDVKGTFGNGKLDLRFPHYSSEGGYEAELRLMGFADGDALKGDWKFGEHGGTFTATRAK